MCQKCQIKTTHFKKQKNNTEKNRQNAWGFFFNSKWPKISYETEYIVQCAKCLSLLRITQSGKTCLYSRERALPSTARAGQAFVPTGAGFDPSKNRPLQCLRQQNSATKIKARPFFLYYSLWLLRSSSRSVILKAKCVLQLPGVLAYSRNGYIWLWSFLIQHKKCLLFCHVTINIYRFVIRIGFLNRRSLFCISRLLLLSFIVFQKYNLNLNKKQLLSLLKSDFSVGY